MAGSTYGKILTMTTWGESHGAGVGVVVDGCPAGLALCEEDVQRYLDRRKPGQSRFTTKRSESDTVEILSGVFEGRTTGTPISMLVRNQDQHSKDYSEIASYYRPGHADYTFDEKYGFRDYRGGGRSSGRETIGRVAAGAIAAKLLESLNIQVKAYTKAIGPVEVAPDRFDLAECEKNKLYMPDAVAAAEAEQYLERKMAEKDSAGGIVECVIAGLPAGLGEPVFDKFNANLAKAICSIGAVKGFEIGEGFHAAQMAGSENNDAFVMDPDGSIGKATNHAGGILGGMTDGREVVFRAAFKPTPSIAAEQRTVNKSGEEISISIKGRHDPIIVPRAVVVVETMAAFAAADMLLGGMTARLAELEAEGRAAILIPSPNVAENHQYYNAMELQKAGAAVVIEEKDLTGEKLVSTVSGLLAEPGKLAVMGKNARTLSVDDSLDRIADALMKLVKTP